MRNPNYTDNEEKDKLLRQLYEMQAQCEWLRMNMSELFKEPDNILTRLHGDIIRMQDWLLEGYRWHLNDGSIIRNQQEIERRIRKIRRILKQIENKYRRERDEMPQSFRNEEVR